MSTEAMAGQFEFLNRMRKERRVVSLYLVSGIRFLGRVVSFDREGLLLDTKHGQLLFQQRQISTIGPDLPKARTLRAGPAGEHADRPYGERASPRREPMVMRESGVSGPGMSVPGVSIPGVSVPGTPAQRPAVQITRKPRREFVRDPEE